MIYHKLGSTGISVSAVALGCEGLSGKTAAEVKHTLDYAIAKGINFIDLYTSNPDDRSHIGDALAGKRSDFVVQGHLCTTWDNGQYRRTRRLDEVKAAFADLLRRLRTDYVDVGMIHYVDDERDFRTVIDSGIMDYARQLKREGHIRHIGLSSHNPVVARLAVESGDIEVLMFSINPCYDLQPPTEDCEDLWDESHYTGKLHNIDPARESLYELCESRGVGIDVMKTFGGGDLLSEDDSPLGKALTPVQCIEYALTRPAAAAVMVGCKTTGEIDRAVAWCLASANERDYASAMCSAKRFSWQGHCMYCGHCAPCSAHIDIASVNKFYRLAQGRGEIPETVREHYRSLTHHASDCMECHSCETRCPFGVEIVEDMRQAAKLFGY